MRAGAWLTVLCLGCSGRALPLPEPSKDLGVARDLAAAPLDLSIGARDLSLAGDLSASLDLATAHDLSMPRDSSTPPDLSTSPDLGGARSWVEVPVPGGAYVEDISGWSSAVLLALEGSVSSYDGTTWTVLLDGTSDPTYEGGFTSVYAASPTEYYATVPQNMASAGQSTIFTYDGQSWTRSLAVAGDNFRLYRLMSGEMVVVGRSAVTSPTFGGVVYVLQAGTWSELVDGDAADFAGFWGTSPTDFYASGWPSFLGHYTSAGWQEIAKGPLDRFFFTWGTGSDVYVGGNGVFRWDGTMFTQVVPGGVELYDVWGVASDRAYAVGCTVAMGSCAGAVLYYFDGTSWSTQPAPAGKQASRIWGRSDRDLWLAVDGKLYHSE